MLGSLDAAALSARTAGPLAAPPAPSGAAGSSAPPGFGETVARLASDAADTVRSAEAASLGAMTGESGLREAVDRVMEAERTLRAAVSVRDKLVSGWLDISRMQI